MKLKSVRLICLIIAIIPQNIIAGPRPVDETPTSPLSSGVALVLGIVFLIVIAIGYFKLKDQNGNSDEGCGCLLLIAICAVILGVIAL